MGLGRDDKENQTDDGSTGFSRSAFGGASAGSDYNVSSRGRRVTSRSKRGNIISNNKWRILGGTAVAAFMLAQVITVVKTDLFRNKDGELDFLKPGVNATLGNAVWEPSYHAGFGTTAGLGLSAVLAIIYGMVYHCGVPACTSKPSAEGTELLAGQANPQYARLQNIRTRRKKLAKIPKSNIASGIVLFTTAASFLASAFNSNVAGFENNFFGNATMGENGTQVNEVLAASAFIAGVDQTALFAAAVVGLVGFAVFKVGKACCGARKDVDGDAQLSRCGSLVNALRCCKAPQHGQPSVRGPINSAKA